MVGETIKGSKYYFDKEDFDLISKYYWKKNSRNDVVAVIDDKATLMHHLLLGEGQYIHINGNNSDNRKDNLCCVRGFKNNGKVLLNGYISIYKPEHNRAFENGCVYEHILVAEKMLGRELKASECVHHIDKNRMNNSTDNLIIFSSSSDHIRYHGGGQLIPNGDGTYKCKSEKIIIFQYSNRTKKDILNDIEDKGSVIVIEKNDKKKIPKNICPICNNNFKDIKAKMCIECRKKENSSHIPDKETLKELILKNSFEKIGREYGVTGKAVVKWCKKYGLPSKRSEINKVLKEKNASYL